MWTVEDLELAPVELDFSSSGLGRHTATAISAGGVRLTNAIELVSVEPAATQVEVCECCGCSNCSPGGWVSFRRIGHGVVWLPAWDEMDRGEWESSEYRPPSFLRTKGAPIFSRAGWERLCALQPALPASEEIPGINSREIVRLCQLSAPGRLLGEYPGEPRVRRDFVIAVTEGDLSTEIGAVDGYLHDNYVVSDPMRIVGDSSTVAPIEFWLDLPGIPGWTSFARVGNRLCVVMDERTVLMRDEGGIVHGARATR